MATRLRIFVAVFVSLFAAQVFGQKADNELITRTFKVDVEAFTPKYKARATGPREDGVSSAVTQVLRRQFAAAGIEFPENPFAVTTLPTEKSMFLNERTGELTVRASREELDRIDNMIALMQKAPPMVQIEARFVEGSAVELPSPLRPVSKPLTNVSVLTEKQFRGVLTMYENSRGVDVVTTPRIVTISGRQARLGAEPSNPSKRAIYQDPPKLPRNTSPDADPTPRNLGRLPFPPGFEPAERR